MERIHDYHKGMCTINVISTRLNDRVVIEAVVFSYFIDGKLVSRQYVRSQDFNTEWLKNAFNEMNSILKHNSYWLWASADTKKLLATYFNSWFDSRVCFGGTSMWVYECQGKTIAHIRYATFINNTNQSIFCYYVTKKLSENRNIDVVLTNSTTVNETDIINSLNGCKHLLLILDRVSTVGKSISGFDPLTCTTMREAAIYTWLSKDVHKDIYIIGENVWPNLNIYGRLHVGYDKSIENGYEYTIPEYMINMRNWMPTGQGVARDNPTFGFVLAKVTAPDNILNPIIPSHNSQPGKAGSTWSGWYFLDELKVARDVLGYEFTVIEGVQFDKFQPMHNLTSRDNLRAEERAYMNILLSEMNKTLVLPDIDHVSIHIKKGESMYKYRVYSGDKPITNGILSLGLIRNSMKPSIQSLKICERLASYLLSTPMVVARDAYYRMEIMKVIQAVGIENVALVNNLHIVTTKPLPSSMDIQTGGVWSNASGYPFNTPFIRAAIHTPTSYSIKYEDKYNQFGNVDNIRAGAYHNQLLDIISKKTS